jgi:hypothetical protein
MKPSEESLIEEFKASPPHSEPYYLLKISNFSKRKTDFKDYYLKTTVVMKEGEEIKGLYLHQADKIIDVLHFLFCLVKRPDSDRKILVQIRTVVRNIISNNENDISSVLLRIELTNEELDDCGYTQDFGFPKYNLDFGNRRSSLSYLIGPKLIETNRQLRNGGQMINGSFEPFKILTRKVLTEEKPDYENFTNEEGLAFDEVYQYDPNFENDEFHVYIPKN